MTRVTPVRRSLPRAGLDPRAGLTYCEAGRGTRQNFAPTEYANINRANRQAMVSKFKKVTK